MLLLLRFLRFFKIQKRDFLRFFALLHMLFSRTMVFSKIMYKISQFRVMCEAIKSQSVSQNKMACILH